MTSQPRSRIDQVAFANKEMVHRIVMTSMDNEERDTLFKRAFSDQLTEEEMTPRECISVMCSVELEVCS